MIVKNTLIFFFYKKTVFYYVPMEGWEGSDTYEVKLANKAKMIKILKRQHLIIVVRSVLGIS